MTGAGVLIAFVSRALALRHCNSRAPARIGGASTACAAARTHTHTVCVRASRACASCRVWFERPRTVRLGMTRETRSTRHHSSEGPREQLLQIVPSAQLVHATLERLWSITIQHQHQQPSRPASGAHATQHAGWRPAAPAAPAISSGRTAAAEGPRHHAAAVASRGRAASSRSGSAASGRGAADARVPHE